MMHNKDLGISNCGGRDRFGIVNLGRLLHPSQFGRWRPRRQLPLGLFRHTLLELDEDFFKVDAQAFKVGNLLDKVGRELHLGEVDSALLQHRDGRLDARLGIANLAKSCLGTRLLEVRFSN